MIPLRCGRRCQSELASVVVVVLGGVVQHVVQRGNDRQACFFRVVDYIRYLQGVREATLKYGCQVHAYVLMTNHVHLLVTSLTAGAVARMMQAVGRRCVRYINDSIGRTGTLWEGRYKLEWPDFYRHLTMGTTPKVSKWFVAAA